MAIPKREAHRPSRKAELLEAALEEFAVGDISEISMAKIAARVGMTTAAVYYHFKTKEALLEVLLAQTNDSLVEIVVVAQPGMDISTWVNETTVRFGKWVRQHPEAARFLFITASAPNPTVRNLRLKAHNRVVNALGEQLRAIDPNYFDTTTSSFAAGALLVMYAEVVRSQLKNGTTVPRSFNIYMQGAQMLAQNIVAETPAKRAPLKQKTART